MIDSGIANNGVAVVKSHVVPVSNGEMGNHMGMRERGGGKEREKKRKREREKERKKERKKNEKETREWSEQNGCHWHRGATDNDMRGRPRCGYEWYKR